MWIAFATGLGIGLFVGCAIGCVIAGLCAASARLDIANDRLTYQLKQDKPRNISSSD